VRFVSSSSFYWRVIVRYTGLLISVAIVAVSASAVWSADPKSDLAALNGAWALTSGVSKGETMAEDSVKAIHLVLVNGKYTAKVGDVTDKGTYTIDTGTTPNKLTLEGTAGPNKGKKMLAIYELDKGTLKVCYDTSGKAFPAKFESKSDSSSFLATYERQKRTKRPIRAASGATEQ
jgi:uncharacterized protein (TIGR03067 family)